MTVMDINEIMEYLPHRYPMLLVDRVVEFKAGEEILAVKNITMNEPYFMGHFPSRPVLPGVMIMEALAQAAALLYFKTLNTPPDHNAVYYFVGIDNARFKKPVGPGDQLFLRAFMGRVVRGIAKFKAQAEVDGQIVAEAELMTMMRGR